MLCPDPGHISDCLNWSIIIEGPSVCVSYFNCVIAIPGDFVLYKFDPHSILNMTAFIISLHSFLIRTSNFAAEAEPKLDFFHVLNLKRS